jgi:hypothetical protein
MSVCVMLVRRRKILIAGILLILLSCQEWVQEVRDVEGGKRFVVRSPRVGDDEVPNATGARRILKTFTVYRS